ncbi:MAG TPA: hypothetical protein VI814_15520 [Candidatus Limnocylindria bacterium]
MNNILKYLREQAKNYDCSVCGTNHSRSKIDLLGKRDGGWVVRVACSKCETAITLLVYVGDSAPSARPVAQQAARRRRPPVTLDEVLDAHDMLESFSGDVRDLFAPRGKVRSSADR